MALLTNIQKKRKENRNKFAIKKRGKG